MTTPQSTPQSASQSPQSQRTPGTPQAPRAAARQDANSPRNLRRRAAQVWQEDLGRDERAAILSWGAFSLTFASVRALTHWIRDGHGPKSGGLSLGGQHFHHYNLGIAGLTALGSLLVQAEARERMADHPVIPTSYGVSTALIADEAALLLDLQDVYWAPRAARASTSRSASSPVADSGSPWCRSPTTSTAAHPISTRPRSRRQSACSFQACR